MKHFGITKNKAQNHLEPHDLLNLRRGSARQKVTENDKCCSLCTNFSLNVK
jgi:hypothetical protein